MKKIHIMLCLALGILVSGCFTSYVSTKQNDSIAGRVRFRKT